MKENEYQPTSPRSTVPSEPTTNITEAPTLEPARTLTCCCCGESTRGRQWWNRDIGFGVCPPCVVFVRRKGETQIQSLYGIAGVHYDVKE